MKVLVACEYSGVVREAFRKLGHDAWSCDLLPTEIPGNHDIDDALNLIYGSPNRDAVKIDLLIAHPPCTHLAVSGARWFKTKQSADLDNAEWFFSSNDSTQSF